MTFQELLDEVYAITGRPDLEAETKSAIKAATLRAHHTDYYSKDIYETGVKFESPAYTQSLDYIALIGNFRALKYIRKIDENTMQAGDFIQVAMPEQLFDEYGAECTDVCYVAGRVIEIKSSTQISTLLIGAYVDPIIVEQQYSSWIAELYPFAIIYEACRILYTTIGDQARARGFREQVAQEFVQLRQMALTDVGY